MGSLPLTREQRQMAHRLRAKGLTMSAIAKDLGCTSGGVCDIVNGKRVGPEASDGWTPAPGRLASRFSTETVQGCPQHQGGHSGRSIGSTGHAL